MPPKKGKKMDLGSFLADESVGGGSWADEEVDFGSISIPVQNKSSFEPSGIPGPNMNDPAFGGFERKERVEYPVPDAPPYRARLNNLPWDANEEIIIDWLEGFVGPDTTSNLFVPRDFTDPSRLKGNAFVTFNQREELVESLKLSGTEMNGRRVFVNVAAPEKEGFGRRGGMGSGGADLDWGAARGPLPPRDDFRGDRPPRREEPDLDWGSARGSAVPRFGGERGERKPRREEPNLDWNSARTGPRAEPTGFEGRPPREPRGDGEFKERKPRREEPEFDWGSARGSGTPSRPEFKERKPRKEEPDLDWGSARSTVAAPSRPARTFNKERTNKPKSAADEADVWARGQQPTGGASKAKTQAKEEQSEESKPTSAKSAFSVLANDDDDDEEEKEEEKKEEEPKVEEKQSTGLEQATSQLSVEDNAAWETVGKKK